MKISDTKYFLTFIFCFWWNYLVCELSNFYNLPLFTVGGVHFRWLAGFDVHYSVLDVKKQAAEKNNILNLKIF